MKAILVAGLGFGDEGKGTIVDALTRKHQAKLVVRYNGGAQAAHHVVTDAYDHCFAQWGAGTFAGAHTHLSKFMMIDPLNMLNEADHLKLLGYKPFELLTVDPQAPILTPSHRALNRLREISRGKSAHGSCGLGIGELGFELDKKLEVLRAWDVWQCPTWMNAKLTLAWQRERHIEEATKLKVPYTDTTRQIFELLNYNIEHYLQRIGALGLRLVPTKEVLQGHETVIFEGAQGVLLDERYGFHPYTTWSNTTFGNAFKLMPDEGYELTRIGVTRAYQTRHGAGPFPTQCNELRPSLRGQEHNTHGRWQGNFRVGHLDLMLLAYARKALGGIDEIALTCVDQLDDYKIAVSYNPHIDELASLPHTIEEQSALCQCLCDIEPEYVFTDEASMKACIEAKLHTPITIVSRGPTAKDKEFLQPELA